MWRHRDSYRAIRSSGKSFGSLGNWGMANSLAIPGSPVLAIQRAAFQLNMRKPSGKVEAPIGVEPMNRGFAIPDG